MKNAFLASVFGSMVAASAFVSAASAQDAIFDELRFGLSASIQTSNNYESGLFPSATVFFDPFDQAGASSFMDHVLRPRVHVGAIVSTDNGANQVFAGFTWTADLTDRIFLDLSFGGSLTDASLDNPNRRPNVGCRAQFHEAAALGYKITENWRVLATIEHSSNADLCDQNDGLSYAGIAVGYKF